MSRSEVKCGDAEQGVVLINVADAQPQSIKAAEQLRSIVKIVESVRSDIIISQGHEIDLFLIHQFLNVHVSYR